MRTIAHVDLDAFYVSVELRRRPELRGLPVVVAGSGPRAVVTTASYEAREFGVGSATPASRARRLCPDAVFVPPDFEAYRAVSRQVMDRVRATVPTVEVAGLDEAYLDLSDLVAPHAAMRRLIAEIRDTTGLACSVGIGPSKLVAKVASDAEKPRGFVVLSRDEACARFAQAPPGLLPGVGPKTAERLDAMGIATIAALAAASPDALAERFGARLGPYLARRARFEDDAPVTSVRVAVSESRETTFDRDIAALEEMEEVLDRLTGRLCEALVRQDRRGRTIGIKVRLDDFSTHTRARTLPRAVNAAAEVGGVARELLREFAPPRPVRLLGVRVASFEAAVDDAAPQLALPV
ncbi:MAG: polymerase [Solirubrobacteraceae bacterium]|jgi:DNA polymerase-4|nr:polymerase [Solirubrobacteraceae bacterium]